MAHFSIVICFDFSRQKRPQRSHVSFVQRYFKTVIDTRSRRESSLPLPVVNNATITRRRVARYRHSRTYRLATGVKIAKGHYYGHLCLFEIMYKKQKKIQNVTRDSLRSVCVCVCCHQPRNTYNIVCCAREEVVVPPVYFRRICRVDVADFPIDLIQNVVGTAYERCTLVLPE